MANRTEITIMPDGSTSTSSTSSTLEIHPGGGSTSTVVTSSGSVSSSFSSSSSSQMAKSMTGSASSSTTKTTKQTSSTSKTTRSSTSVMKSSTMKTSSRAISIKSNTSSFSDTFGRSYGIDVDAEMKKLMAGADQEMQSVKEKFFNLRPLALTGAGADVIKLDSSTINDYVDKKDNDRLKFNFDVTQFESESISVKSDGNKIEVHAKKRSKIGDDESNEEYSRTYELPTTKELDADKVTSSFFKDGILTVELPVSEAIASS